MVPHHELHFLPFEALRGDLGCLVERYALSYAPSVSLLALCIQRQRQTCRRLLALGNPDLGDARLSLKYAEHEVLAIAPHFGVGARIGCKATLEAVRSHWREADILHLACHAEWNREQPELSALRLTPADGDDGRLTVREILSLEEDLPFGLVTLSACNTSLGTGNDLTGLATAFLYAGASSVIASLWPVNDLSTSELMVQLYENLTGTDRANALRSAQLRLLRDPGHAHPYFWAAFRLIGNPLALEGERPRPASPFNLMHRWTWRCEDGYLARPALGNDVIYATWIEKGEESRGFCQGAIYALSSHDRNLIWKHPSQPEAECLCIMPELVHVNTAARIYALQKEGGLTWERQTGSLLSQSLEWDGQTLFVGGHSSSVYALCPEDGNILWEYRLPRPGSGGFAVGGGRVFVGCNNHRIYALHAKHGTLLWGKDLGWGEWTRQRPAWVAGNRLYTALGAFDIATGKWDREARCKGEIVVDGCLQTERLDELPRGRSVQFDERLIYWDGALLLSSDKDGTLSLIDVRTGQLLRRLSLGCGRATGIDRSGDLIVIGDGDGALYGFSTAALAPGDASP